MQIVQRRILEQDDARRNLDPVENDVEDRAFPERWVSQFGSSRATSA
jgi:hypothetical protein